MAARAEFIGDTGESAPARWEPPFGTGQVHVVLSLLAADQESLAVVLERARKAHAQLRGLQVVHRQDFYQLSSGRTSFGYKDGIGNPAIEGSGAESPPGDGSVLKAGEFVLGYRDETGNLPPMPQPAELGRNGTFVAWRKLHARRGLPPLSPRQLRQPGGGVAARRQDRGPLAERRPADPGARARRPGPGSGRPAQQRLPLRVRSAWRDLPHGAHARRANPRDSEIIGDVRLHHMIRRGTNYGPRFRPASWTTTAPTVASSSSSSARTLTVSLNS